jgi:glycine cleavage system H protein
VEKRYTQTHEWIGLNDDGTEGTVGITDFAQKEVTDVVFVELPKIGKKVPRGGETAIIESVKAAFSIYAPMGGEVIAGNQELDSNPALLNQDPLGRGWIFRLKLDNPGEYSSLMDEKAYNAYLSDGGGQPGHG